MFKKMLKNWPLKLLAVILALVVWFVIMSLADPTQTRTIGNIPIEILHEEILSNADKAFTINSQQTTTVRVTGPSSMVRGLKVSDFKATADMEELYDVTGQVPLHVSCLVSGISTSQISQTDVSVKVSIEDIVSKRFPIDVETVGTLPEGYYQGEAESVPRYVTVKAPESVIERIAYVKAAVDISDLTDNAVYTNCPLYYYSAADNLLNLSNAAHTTFSAESVTVTVDILTMKTVPVVISGVSGQDEVQEGYRYVDSKQSVTAVQVSGLKSRLATISVISIPEEALSVAGASSDVSYDIDLTQYLPEGVTLRDGQDTVMNVVLYVEELVTQSFEVSGLLITGQDDKYEYKADSDTVTIELRAAEADFSGLKDLSMITISVNAADLEPGEYVLPVLVSCSDSVFEPVGEATATITITDPTPPTTEEPTTEEESEENTEEENLETDEFGEPVETSGEDDGE
ncbi:MAG: hypothetical protein II882_05350 [Lachnospiraceae bacterium]|nr:hypothetical protein [Lachnospiraceae bacterium]